MMTSRFVNHSRALWPMKITWSYRRRTARKPCNLQLFAGGEPPPARNKSLNCGARPCGPARAAGLRGSIQSCANKHFGNTLEKCRANLERIPMAAEGVPSPHDEGVGRGPGRGG